MDKYRLFDKIIKTKAANYFRAEEIDSRENVVVKKINKSTSWEELLKDKDLTLMKQSKVKYFPLIRQIVKDQDQFYIILQKMDKNLQYVIKADIEKQDIFKISRHLINMLLAFSQHKVHPREIRPAHIFVDDNLNKITLAHLQTVPKDITKLDLVQLQDLRYLSPEQVLTSKEIDERSAIFSVGLIICDLILGRSLINANTKMNYMYEICRLFPQDSFQKIEGSEHNFKESMTRGENFETIIRRYNYSNEFIALLRQMLKVDRNQRVLITQLLDAFDVIVQNQHNYLKKQEQLKEQVQIQDKPNHEQFPIHDEIDLQIDFEFQEKSTLSTVPTLKSYSHPLPTQKNVEDDSVQPIIIKQNSRNEHSQKVNLNTTKQTSTKQSRVTHKHPSLSTIRKPQLTNYALNQANVGLQMGMNPSIFSQNQI